MPVAKWNRAYAPGDSPDVKKVTVKLTPQGVAHFILTDDLQPLLEQGKSRIKRASHVEPSTLNGRWVWYAELHPVNGPTLGPFGTRKEALDAEVEWLENNYIRN